LMDFWAYLRKVQWHISECCDLGAFCLFFVGGGGDMRRPRLVFGRLFAFGHHAIDQRYFPQEQRQGKAHQPHHQDDPVNGVQRI
jgi:hypothetical protein